MKPYRGVLPGPSGMRFWLMWWLVGVAVAMPAMASAPRRQNGNNKSPARAETLTRSAFEHFYNLEYDKAVREFERMAEAHPEDPFVANHLLTGVLFRELYRIGALDSELYAKDSFLTSRQLPPDPKVRAHIRELTETALALSEARLKEDPNDLHALYARGCTRGLRSTTSGLLDKSWFAALRSAVGARRDHERVLQLEPSYSDAKLMVGVHNYVVGSVSWVMKAAASVIGISGSKKKGIQYLYEAANGGGEASTDAKIALALFLRREQRYAEAIELVDGLMTAYPRNFLYAAEHAHLLNAAGHGPEAITAYRKILENADKGLYPDARLEQVVYGLGEALRGQRKYVEAAQAYDSVQAYKRAAPELRSKASLAAGEMYDLLHQRETAVKKYREVLEVDTTSEYAQLARRRIKQPYQER